MSARELRGTPGIYLVEHPALGSFRLFLAPVGRPSTVERYEAIVDRFCGRRESTRPRSDACRKTRPAAAPAAGAAL